MPGLLKHFQSTVHRGLHLGNDDVVHGFHFRKAILPRNASLSVEFASSALIVTEHVHLSIFSIESSGTSISGCPPITERHCGRRSGLGYGSGKKRCRSFSHTHTYHAPARLTIGERSCRNDSQEKLMQKRIWRMRRRLLIPRILDQPSRCFHPNIYFIVRNARTSNVHDASQRRSSAGIVQAASSRHQARW